MSRATGSPPPRSAALDATPPADHRAPPAPSATPTAEVAGQRHAPTAPRLSITEFLDAETLQEIQDSFTTVTRLATTIRDPGGAQVTQPTDVSQRAESDSLLEHLIEPDEDNAGRYVAPIVMEGQELGSIVIEKPHARDSLQHLLSEEDRGRLYHLAHELGIEDRQLGPILEAAESVYGSKKGASVQFLHLMANSIARLCYEQYHAHQRVEELSVLYEVSTLLAAHRDLQQVLDTATRSIAEVMRVKAVSIRLLERGRNLTEELVPKAVYNLSEHYVNKGAVGLEQSPVYSQAMAGEPVYIEDMATDPRTIYPEHAREEGIASMLVAGIAYQGKPIGTVQLFTQQTRRFTKFELRLVTAITQLLSAAIQNARLDEERRSNQQMVRQLHLAADVQRRMLPSRMPRVAGFDIAARYVPSYELGGDFYDFINLEGHLGVAVGDVVGKGVAASLLMASVRASLRAYAQDVYNLDEVIRRVNKALCRDTRDDEFATLWYGVLNPASRQLTYCNAGHEPPLLMRGGKLTPLSAGGMIVGVDAGQDYDKGVADLEPGDTVLLFTDGLPDAMNAEDQRFGRERVERVFADALAREAPVTAQDVLNHILWEVRSFTGPRRSTDDNTLVVLRVADPPDTAQRSL